MNYPLGLIVSFFCLQILKILEWNAYWYIWHQNMIFINDSFSIIINFCGLGVVIRSLLSESLSLAVIFGILEVIMVRILL